MDQRLEKHGIKVECGTTLTKLISPDGGVLFAKRFGSATYFERCDDDAEVVLDAIKKKYGVTIVYDDHSRFWAFKNQEQMDQAFQKVGVAFPMQFVTTMECPAIEDAEFGFKFLNMGTRANQELKALLADDCGLRNRLSELRLILLLDFASTAMVIANRRRQEFAVHVAEDESEVLTVMVALKFFALTTLRYQMIVPAIINRTTLREAIIQLIETEDRNGHIHPECLLSTLSLEELNGWMSGLVEMDRDKRLADRKRSLAMLSVTRRMAKERLIPSKVKPQ